MTTDHLPPAPYQYLTTAPLDRHEGAGHVYIVDAAGRKIMNLWGKPDEKLAMATLVIEARESLDQAERLRETLRGIEKYVSEDASQGSISAQAGISILNTINRALAPKEQAHG